MWGSRCATFWTDNDPDVLRSYLTIAGPETSDTDFTWAEFVRRTNDELVDNWGNLVHRTLSLTHRHFGQVPDTGQLAAADSAMLASVDGGFDRVGAELDGARSKAALMKAMHLSASVNRYLGEQEPWKLVGVDRERAASVLCVAFAVRDESGGPAFAVPAVQQPAHPRAARRA